MKLMHNSTNVLSDMLNTAVLEGDGTHILYGSAPVNPVGFGIGISTCTRNLNQVTKPPRKKKAWRWNLRAFQEILTSRLTAKAGQWRPTTSNHTDLDCKTNETTAQIRHTRRGIAAGSLLLSKG